MRMNQSTLTITSSIRDMYFACIFYLHQWLLYLKKRKILYIYIKTCSSKIRKNIEESWMKIRK